MYLKRFDTNPLITPEMDSEIGSNINGPTLIRVPDFVKNPLGKYYLYFGHHHGQFIRLAYSDYPDRDFRILPEGVLPLKQVMEESVRFCGHISSPEIRIDPENQRILLYFHAGYRRDENTPPEEYIQRSSVAVSEDGLHFTLLRHEAIDCFYMRVFSWRGRYYSISKNENSDAQLAVCEEPDGIYRRVGNMIPFVRHTAVRLEGDTVYLFYTKVGEPAERIYCSRFIMEEGDCWDPKLLKTILIAEPSTDREGLCYPAEPSRFGSQNHVRQLRDPDLYEENGVFYLYYSYAGEDGIAGGILDMDAVRRDLA